LEVNNLLAVYQRNAQIGILYEELKNNASKIFLNGSKASFISIAASVIAQKLENRHHIMLVEDREKASYLQNDIENLLGKNYSAVFPMSYKRVYQFEEIDNANILERAEVLNKITEYYGKPFIVISYPEAIAEKVVNKQTLVKNSQTISLNDQLDIEFLSEVLIEYGFRKVDFVYEAGDFSVRGGIIDVFSFAYEKPYRIELWGNEVESIRTFDPENQRSLESVQRLILTPDIQNKLQTETRESLFEFLKEPIVWVEDFKYCRQVIENYFDKCSQQFETIQTATNQSAILYKPEHLFLSVASFKKEIEALSVIEFGSKNAIKATKEIGISIKSQPSYNKKFDLLAKDLLEKKSKGYAIVVCSDSSKQLEKIQAILDEQKGPEVDTLNRSLYGGFTDDDERLVLFTDHQLFDRFHRFRTRTKYSRSKSLTLHEIKNLQPGDFVTHIDFGVGRFAGLEIKEVDGRKQESVRLIFKGDDILYVGVHALHKIAKYSGKDGTAPQLSKLGSGEWEKKKSKVKSKVKELAIDLLKLYAKRLQSHGWAFSPDGYLQTELETSFIYEDTPDQAKATADVKKDMEANNPMDRLVCGDVGFGKTEIAIRAAMKAAADGKQVAVLVPTTVLALQHFKTFKKRLEEMPVTVDYVNRFRTTKEIKEITERLKDGQIDILIGTHALVSQKFKFKDLGLLIIDEEQKFGVGVKEKLKEFRADIDVLTLTATPIPRTLQFSLMGARDLSVIHTPPPNRQPVTTEVHHFDEEIIRDAVSAELRRGGQVFFVHNRVADIDSVGAIIRKLVPDCTLCVAHGQMDGKLLEKTMMEFVEHEYDVLVSTNIIESGIDIPNANTIIINNAHHYGLSDLHQMRGRVGRSNKKAFCYLITPTFFSATSDSMKRLRTLEEFSDLGDGFKIAMKDLDLRGAGDVLGGEQSGFISDIGFETYQKLLEEAIEELKEKEFKSLFEPKLDYQALKTDCNLETDLELLIPEQYVSNISERLRLYNKLDNLKQEQDLELFKQELVDRFGPMPEVVEELVTSVKLRWEAERLGFEKFSLKNGKGMAYVPVNKSRYFQSDLFGKILAYIQSNPKRGGLKEQKDKMVLTFEPIRSIKQAIDTLKSI
jgi:transcription-repair coupling factor (superfamily II helicase)